MELLWLSDKAIKRWARCQWLKQHGIPLVTIGHSKSCISPYACIILGSIVFAGAVIAVINVDIDHDCLLGAAVHVTLGVHLSGYVTVSACSWIGLGNSIKQGITTGSDVTVDAGAVVNSDVPDKVTVVGNPSKKL